MEDSFNSLVSELNPLDSKLIVPEIALNTPKPVAIFPILAPIPLADLPSPPIAFWAPSIVDVKLVSRADSIASKL